MVELVRAEPARLTGFENAAVNQVLGENDPSEPIAGVEATEMTFGTQPFGSVQVTSACRFWCVAEVMTTPDCGRALAVPTSITVSPAAMRYGIPLIGGAPRPYGRILRPPQVTSVSPSSSTFVGRRPCDQAEKLDGNGDTSGTHLSTEKTKTPHLRGVLKRMNGLEPSTFCMARTWREATGTDWSRHSFCYAEAALVPMTATDSNRQRNLTENLTKPKPNYRRRNEMRWLTEYDYEEPVSEPEREPDPEPTPWKEERLLTRFLTVAWGAWVAAFVVALVVFFTWFVLTSGPGPGVHIDRDPPEQSP
jgi:hypothetical protein